ncbi:tRNA ligase class II core domain protein [Necator americanus]|uniref:proline--tRNA ligase n=1 Tax=Necator americanus TaxID=51031 RepID=W2SLV9_NECAM|nr:tRNA ligase class II core domain protein [Necator americanus]ETN70610.1 tRNA ligase class II core domain protein [Necator americanus]
MDFVSSFLPLGQRVIDKLLRLVDYELESIGAMKVHMPILGPRAIWEKTARWESMGAELFKIQDRHKQEMCLQPTAEEMCTELIAQLPLQKKRMFPLLIYQTTEKFRDEMNPRFGLLRSRQFLMKDLYTFDLNKDSASETYKNVCRVYDRILRDHLRLEVYKVVAQPGLHGGSISHEYHLPNPLEEDGIHFCSKLLPAIVSLLSSSEKAIRLPTLIAPFSAAVVVTKGLMDNVMTELTLSSLDRRLSGGILLDDRVEDNVGKRIKELRAIGIPRIVVLGKATEKTINKTPKVEYFPPQEDPEHDRSQEWTLNEVMQSMG